MLNNLTLLEPVLNRKLLAEFCWDKASRRIRVEPRVVARREIRHDGGEVDGLADPASDPGLEDANRHVLHQRVYRNLQQGFTQVVEGASANIFNKLCRLCIHPWRIHPSSLPPCQA